MNVRELIEILSKLDQEKRIVVNGYEGGYCDVEKDSIVELNLILDVNEDPYCGPHSSVWSHQPFDVIAYCISR